MSHFYLTSMRFIVYYRSFCDFLLLDEDHESHWSVDDVVLSLRRPPITFDVFFAYSLMLFADDACCADYISSRFLL